MQFSLPRYSENGKDCGDRVRRMCVVRLGSTIHIQPEEEAPIIGNHE